MGRLFWKFFLFIWLAQLAGIIWAGAIFWLEHRAGGDNPALRMPPPGQLLAGPPPPPAGLMPPRFPPLPEGGPDLPPGLPEPRIPFVHLLGASLASLMFAAALAWYVARPIRRLKEAFRQTAEGNFDVRVSAAMGRRRDELVDLGEDFERMVERLRLLMDAQKRLLHDVSHELRSPLARLQAAIGLARQQPERVEESLRRVEREGERMNALVGELLTLSRLEAGVQGVTEEIELAELLADLVGDARYEAASRGVRVELTGGEGVRVQANPELLHRAVENVVRNALRYSPDSACVRVDISSPQDDLCRIRVSDQGPGVRESELEAIFRPFHRGGNATDGYGLGLAIAQRVFTAVNGKIRAINMASGGLCVEMELPRSA